MDPHLHEHNRLAATTSRDSLIDYLNGGQPPTKRMTDRSQNRKSRPQRRRRACPIPSLLVLITYLLICASGTTVTVLVSKFDLQVRAAGTLDTVARILLFVSCNGGYLYVLTHLFAARDHYIRSQATPEIFGFLAVSVAVLIQRLGVPVWTGAVVTTALVAEVKGFNLAEGITGNVVWIQLGIASLGL